MTSRRNCTRPPGRHARPGFLFTRVRATLVSTMTPAPIEFPRGIEVVCGGVIEDAEGRILLTQGTKWGNLWTIPGGHIEPGETVKQGCIREIREETGLTVDAVAVLRWGELINPPEFLRPAHFIFVHIDCRVLGGAVQLDPSEHTVYRWVTPVDALDYETTETTRASITQFIALHGASKPKP